MLDHIYEPRLRSKIAEMMATWNIRVQMAKALFFVAAATAALVFAFRA